MGLFSSFLSLWKNNRQRKPQEIGKMKSNHKQVYLRTRHILNDKNEKLTKKINMAQTGKYLIAEKKK